MLDFPEYQGRCWKHRYAIKQSRTEFNFSGFVSQRLSLQRGGKFPNRGADPFLDIMENKISSPFGRVIPFDRGFVDITGSIEAALLLTRFCFWSQGSKDGWFEISGEQIEMDTGMKDHQQRRSITILLSKGFIDEDSESESSVRYKTNDLDILEKMIGISVSDLSTRKKTKPKKKSASEDEDEKAKLDHFFRRWRDILEDTSSGGKWRDEWESAARREILRFYRKEKIAFWKMYAVCKWARNDLFWKKVFVSPAKLTKKDKNGIQYYFVLADKLSVDDWYSCDPNRNPEEYVSMVESGVYKFKD